MGRGSEGEGARGEGAGRRGVAAREGGSPTARERTSMLCPPETSSVRKGKGGSSFDRSGGGGGACGTDADGGCGRGAWCAWQEGSHVTRA